MEINVHHKIDSVISDKNKIYTWQEDNLPVIKVNAYSMPFSYQSPKLLTATNEFEYGGFQGNMSSWKNYGDWYNKINANRNVLPALEINRIKELIKGIASDKEKVKKIYEYMQAKTRYVAISLGIGGLQPLEAKFVSENGYGDCKALSNYMQSLLEAAGIKSHYTLVKSGPFNNISPDFVCDQFDHIILCVPLIKDTVWLECTNQTIPFNYLGGFTADRYVLLVTPEGGKLAHTPEYKLGDNTVKRKGLIIIDKIGNSMATFNTKYQGIYFDDVSRFEKESEEDLKRYLNENLELSTFEVTKVSFQEIKEEKPISILHYELKIRDFAAESATRIFFVPCLDQTPYMLNKPADIQIKTFATFSDSIIYQVPQEYQIEYIPEKVAIETSFGKYYYSATVKNDKIVFVRTLELNKGKYLKDNYTNLCRFINTIAKKDRERIILKKKADNGYSIDNLHACFIQIAKI
jgi:hypothetical protein